MAAGSKRHSNRSTKLPPDDPRLDRYLAKRNFSLTAEPVGGEGTTQGPPRFVIQLHAARRLHYDVRLEVAGVLKSWAVPRGPSTDPKVKRLAVQTEDHPMDYAGFEGTIQRGQYGGGGVIVWDAGIFHNLTERTGVLVEMDDGLRRGHVKFWLEGEKLQGSWALTRTGITEGPKSQWLMVKVADAAADADADPVRDLPASILSGRTIDDMVGEVAGPASERSRANR